MRTRTVRSSSINDADAKSLASDAKEFTAVPSVLTTGPNVPRAMQLATHMIANAANAMVMDGSMFVVDIDSLERTPLRIATPVIGHWGP